MAVKANDDDLSNIFRVGVKHDFNGKHFFFINVQTGFYLCFYGQCTKSLEQSR